MSYEIMIGVLACFVVFSAGLAAGYWMHKAAHRDGIKLMDRIEHDQQPFEDDCREMKVQSITGGDFEEV